jgi:hypothetical protein
MNLATTWLLFSLTPSDAGFVLLAYGKTGILSLAENRGQPLMWAHYACRSSTGGYMSIILGKGRGTALAEGEGFGLPPRSKSFEICEIVP